MSKLYSISRMEEVFIYLFVILNSISGVQIAGKSINTFLVAAFLIYVVIFYMKHRNGSSVSIPKWSDFIFFNLCSIISCLLSMCYTFSLTHNAVVRGYLVNGAAYVVIFVLFFNCKTESINAFVKTFRDALILTAKINVIWGFLQTGLVYIARFNINQWLFADILHASNDRAWVMGFYSTSGWNIRMTGLNFENSMFAIIVCIGLALVESKVWKTLMTVAVILSLSRTGWVMLVGYYGVLLVKRLMRCSLKVKQKALIEGIAFIVFEICAFLYLYSSSEVFSKMVNNVFLRISDESALNVSAARHYLYYPYGLDIWIMRSSPLQQLFGYGMRCSGIPFSENPDIMSKLGGYQAYTSAWAVECDVIGLLLGGGITTFIAYYSNIFKLIKDNNMLSSSILVILLGGITYHYHSVSYILFVILFSSLSMSKKTFLRHSWQRRNNFVERKQSNQSRYWLYSWKHSYKGNKFSDIATF